MKRSLCSFIVIVVVTLWCLSSLLGAPAQTDKKSDDAAPAGDVDKGKASFASRNCATCHGSDAQGTDGGGPRIGPPPRAWPDFVQYVRKPTGNMPPVSAQRVPDAELADIYAYLLTLGSSKEGSSKDGSSTAAPSAPTSPTGGSPR
jgi:ubiquinol-cytochrome c reductase cytochrome c subunit